MTSLGQGNAAGDVWAAALIIAGLTIAFFGGVLFRSSVTVIGGGLGGFLMYQALTQSSDVDFEPGVLLLIVLGTAIVCALFFRWFLSVQEMLIGAAAGYFCGTMLAAFVKSFVTDERYLKQDWETTFWSIVIVCMFLGAYAGQMLVEKVAIPLASSFIGSVWVISGLSYFLRRFEAVDIAPYSFDSNTTDLQDSCSGKQEQCQPILAAWVVLFLVSLAFQYSVLPERSMKKRRHQEQEIAMA